MKIKNLVVALIGWGIVLSVVVWASPLETGAQSLNLAGLVVQMGDGLVVTRCIEFAEDEISGYDLLMRSGLQVVATQLGGIGVTICEIGGEGCPANNCFCKCTGSTCAYWSYWHLAGGEWSYASVGAHGRRLRSGDVDGWTWGKGDPPPVMSLEQICVPPATATLLPTATPTDTLVPPSPTPLPTDTPPLPTPTPQIAGAATAVPTATWTPTPVPPTQSPTLTPSATPTNSVTLPVPTATLTPQEVATLRVIPSATASESRRDGAGTSNYILFGVLAIALAGVTLIVLRRKR